MLNDKICRELYCPEGQSTKEKGESGGLFIRVQPSQHKSFVVKWHCQELDLRRTKVIGFYPEISLSEARALRDDFKSRLPGGKKDFMTKLLSMEWNNNGSN